jgi:hypothetical protein
VDSRPVREGVSKGEEDGRRPPALPSVHECTDVCTQRVSP